MLVGLGMLAGPGERGQATKGGVIRGWWEVVLYTMSCRAALA